MSAGAHVRERRRRRRRRARLCSSPPVERHATGEKKTPGIESTLPCPSASISPLFHAARSASGATTRPRRLDPRAEILSSSKRVCVPHIVQRFRDLRTLCLKSFFFSFVPPPSLSLLLLLPPLSFSLSLGRCERQITNAHTNNNASITFTPKNTRRAAPSPKLPPVACSQTQQPPSDDRHSSEFFAR